MNKLFLVVFFSLSILGTVYSQTGECEYPWEKISDSVCLLLETNVKSWNNAKFVCNFYGGELLYINNEKEQQLVKDFLSKLIKYRFNKKLNVWLDASDQVNENEWLWSRNNQTLQYSNWTVSSRLNNKHSRLLNCGCFRLRDGGWKDCDCLSTQHFVCRKKNSNEIIVETSNMAAFGSAQSIETTTYKSTTIADLVIESSASLPTDSFHMDLNVLDPNGQEFKGIIISSKILNDDEDKNRKIFNETILIIPTVQNLENEQTIFLNIEKKSDNNFTSALTSNPETDSTSTQTTTLPTTISDDSQILTALSTSSLETTTTSSSSTTTTTTTAIPDLKTITRKVITKQSRSYILLDCPKGLGYYSVVNNNCTQYKICSEWNELQALVTVNKCEESKVFSFVDLECVDENKYPCEPSVFKFVQL